MFELYDMPLFRPPSEAHSLIIQATIGCSHNKCTFCGMYKMKKFRIKSVEEIKKEMEIFKKIYPKTRRIFLADGNALCMETDDLLEILRYARKLFPDLERVSAYATPMDILEKTEEELGKLAHEGLKLIYLGVESGDDQILEEIRKGVDSEKMVEAGRKAIESGMILSVTAITGLGGKDLSYKHAKNTAKALNRMKPQYTAFLTLMIVENTPLHLRLKKGEFRPLNQTEILQELRWVIEDLDYSTVFRANHASNYLPLKANLPEDRDRILKLIDHAMEHPEILRPEYMRAL
ncbi:radical SAM protein [Geoglobus acetivorans]|uniref:B12-binding domain-containing radical SAM protein n=1 Tax=Geoglobus acetivorans TaxID=565033 RepID=A0ABZ3H6I1_GEOAI|nr:B12-binding domain-containing radical SAM protein [Geoglobus acetivorans]